MGDTADLDPTSHLVDEERALLAESYAALPAALRHQPDTTVAGSDTNSALN
jgi:hypothetical protein